MDDRILIWAAPRDARLTIEFLEASGILCGAVRGWAELMAEWGKGGAGLVVASECLTPSVLVNLKAWITAQPAWSDPAIIIVGGEDEGDQVDAAAMPGNVSVLQKPLSLRTLQSTVRAAQRARRRQYQVRDLLHQKDEAERRKDEYLAMLAHELRNPLAPLRTGLKLLRLGPAPEIVSRTHETMERQISNLTRLVDDLLDVSRITQRKIALKKQPVELRELVRQAVEAAQPAAREKALLLQLSLPQEPIPIEADPVRLEQMIGNVLNNASKFTPANGSIRVVVQTRRDQASIHVTDTGVGIASDHLPRVFDLFAQAPRALDRGEGGLGIGLTVVKLLAELHGGSVGIASEGPGKGTAVTIRLPLSGRAVAGATTARLPARPSGGSHRVLVIEDNHDVAETLAAYLEQIGHQVVVAHDGPAGLEAALRHRPKVLICDIGLPGLDGYEIAARLRQEAAFQSCLMIALTGYGDVEDRKRARRAGFAHHFTKPADPVRVANLVAAAADQSHDDATETR